MKYLSVSVFFINSNILYQNVFLPAGRSVNMKKILKEYPFALISYDEEQSMGMIEWKGKCSSEEYRSTFLYLLEYQKKLGLIRYMSDIREQAVISPEDRKWFENEALPKAIEQGLKAAAVVFSGNVFKKYYVNVILQSTNRFGLPMKMFDTPEPAISWLLTKS